MNFSVLIVDAWFKELDRYLILTPCWDDDLMLMIQINTLGTASDDRWWTTDLIWINSTQGDWLTDGPVQWMINELFDSSGILLLDLSTCITLHQLCWAGSWGEGLPISYLQFIIIIIMQIFSIHLITIPHLLCSFFTVIVWMLRIGLVKALWRLVRDVSLGTGTGFN